MNEPLPTPPKSNLIDRIPWVMLVPIAFFMGIAPISHQPHLWEKLNMLAAGTLSRPLDIFDLIMHATPLVLVVIKALRQLRTNKEN